MEFVRRHAVRADTPVLEVGSCNVNGSVRSLFGEPYLGVDVADGNGVDAVIEPNQPLPFDDGTFQTVVSTETLEHALDPVGLLIEMVRVLGPHGLLIVTMRGNGFQYHNPPDRWRAMPGVLAEILRGEGLDTHEENDPQVPGVFLMARKP